MDDHRFDALTRVFATRSRRDLLRALAGAAGGLLIASRRHQAAAGAKPRVGCQPPCSDSLCQRCVGTVCTSRCSAAKCLECDGAGNCQSSCRAELCEVCRGGGCKSRCGADQVCRNGDCVACVRPGETCQNSAACCGGAQCRNGMCCLTSGACRRGDQCCGGFCVDRACASCLPAGEVCVKAHATDCCSDRCEHNRCCSSLGQPCSRDAHCCDGDCDPVRNICCISSGTGPCTSHGDCCSGICNLATGTCCGGAGATCDEDGDCCAPNTCHAIGAGERICCRNTGEVCAETRDCCFGQCGDNGTCCLPEGDVCVGDDQCCSGRCGDDGTCRPPGCDPARPAREECPGLANPLCCHGVCAECPLDSGIPRCCGTACFGVRDDDHCGLCSTVCAEGEICEKDIAAPSGCCRPNGGQCEEQDDCCFGLSCCGGTCVECSPDFTNAVCCGDACVDAACGPNQTFDPTSCACAFQPAGCQGAGKPNGQSCANNGECCTGRCESGVCTCRSLGVSCSRHDQCCHNLLCESGFCNTCACTCPDVGTTNLCPPSDPGFASCCGH